MPLSATDRIDLFRRRARLFRAGRLEKLLRIPWRLGYTNVVGRYCTARATVAPSQADTFWGDSMHVVLPERLSQAIYCYNFIEEGLTSIFLSQVKPGMTVFDIGAHFGYFTLLANWLVGEAGSVHAFEPTPSTFEVLSRNIQGRSRVRVNNVALYSRADVLTFQDYGPVLSQFNSLTRAKLAEDVRRDLRATTHRVTALPLDQYVADSGARPDFVKVDAENAELEILHGAERTIREVRPMITVEVGDVEGDGEAVSSAPVQWLLERGYAAFEYSKQASALRPHQPQSRYAYDNLLLVPQEKAAGVVADPAGSAIPSC
jgi:FkbM family methyltransferase